MTNLCSIYRNYFCFVNGSNIYSLKTSNTFRFLNDPKLNFPSRPWKWKKDSDCSLYSDAYGTESRWYQMKFEGAFLIDWNQFRWNLINTKGRLLEVCYRNCTRDIYWFGLSWAINDATTNRNLETLQWRPPMYTSTDRCHSNLTTSKLGEAEYFAGSHQSQTEQKLYRKHMSQVKPSQANVLTF